MPNHTRLLRKKPSRVGAVEVAVADVVVVAVVEAEVDEAVTEWNQRLLRC